MKKAFAKSVDITDLSLQMCLQFEQEAAVDINFIVGVIFRFGIFTLTVWQRDVRAYEKEELFLLVPLWLIFYFYIIYELIQYLGNGKSKISQRNIYYKLVDLIQHILGVMYLIWLPIDQNVDLLTYFPISGDLGQILLVFCYLNIILIILEFFKMIYFSCCDYETKKEYQVKGGNPEFFFGSLAGTGVMLYYINYCLDVYDSEIDPNRNNNLYLVVHFSLIVEYILGLLYALLFFSQLKEHSKQWQKSVLMLLYGAYNGLFGALITIFVSFFIMLYLIYKLYQCCQRETQKHRVYPQ